MKKILLTIIFLLLFVSVSYSQYIIIDTLNNVVTTTEQQQRDINEILGGTFSLGYTNAQIDAIIDAEGLERLTEVARLDALIVALTVRVQALEDGSPVIITPQPPTDFEVHAISTTEITGTFTEPVDTGDTYIRMRLFSAQGDQLAYDNVDTLEHGVTSFTITGLTPNTTYQFDAYTVVEEVVSPSDFATADTATTWQVPIGGGGGGYESVIYAGLSATGDGDGSSRANQMELRTLIPTVVAGDTIVLDDVLVCDVTTSSINFSANGTVSSPIVWIGTIADDSSYSGENNFGITSTLIYGNSTSNTRITMSGDYNEFHKIIFKQGQARELISYSGRVTFDSCAFKYPSNTSSSSNHLIRGAADHVTFRYSHFYHSPRTAIWHEWTSTTNAPDSLIIENCTFIGHSSHPAFQIMPYTNIVSPAKITGVIIRNNTFIDNPYGDLFYIRHSNDEKIYNNLLVRSGRMSLPIHPVSPYDTCSVGLVAFNTAISNSTNYYFLSNEATEGLIVKNNIIYSTVAFYGNLVYRFQCGTGTPYPPILRHQFDYNMYYNSAYGASFESTARVYWATTACVLQNQTFTTWRTNNAAFDDNSTFTVAPVFTNAGSDDYTLSTNSIGTPISGILTDKNGVTRDISTPSKGAFEYVAP